MNNGTRRMRKMEILLAVVMDSRRSVVGASKNVNSVGGGGIFTRPWENVGKDEPRTLNAAPRRARTLGSSRIRIRGSGFKDFISAESYPLPMRRPEWSFALGRGNDSGSFAAWRFC